RVVEPAEGAEGGGGADVRVVPFAFELACGREGGLGVEVALVGDVADDGEPPGLLLEAVLARGGEHEREGVAVDPGVGGVAAADVEAERAGRERAGLEHELELAAPL